MTKFNHRRQGKMKNNTKTFKTLLGNEQPTGLINFLDDLVINKIIGDDECDKVLNMNDTELTEYFSNYQAK